MGTLNILNKIGLFRNILKTPGQTARVVSDNGTLFEVITRRGGRLPHGAMEIGDITRLTRAPKGAMPEPASALLSELEALKGLGGDIRFSDPSRGARFLLDEQPLQEVLFDRPQGFSV